jgi:hypothetical protein
MIRSRTGEYHKDDEDDIISHSLLKDLIGILISEYYEIQVSMLVCAYGSTARTLRSVLEATVNIFAALVDKSIFTRKASDKGLAMCGNEFFHNLALQQFRKGKEDVDGQKLLDKWV